MASTTRQPSLVLKEDVKKDVSLVPAARAMPKAPELEGYLKKMKRSQKLSIGSWNRRWFVVDIETRQLRYYKDRESRRPQGYIDLNEITAVVEFDDRHFQIESRQRNFFLKGKSKADCNCWVRELEHYRREMVEYVKYKTATPIFALANAVSLSPPHKDDQANKEKDKSSRNDKTPVKSPQARDSATKTEPKRDNSRRDNSDKTSQASGRDRARQRSHPKGQRSRSRSGSSASDGRSSDSNGSRSSESEHSHERRKRANGRNDHPKTTKGSKSATQRPQPKGRGKDVDVDEESRRRRRRKDDRSDSDEDSDGNDNHGGRRQHHDRDRSRQKGRADSNSDSADNASSRRSKADTGSGASKDNSKTKQASNSQNAAKQLKQDVKVQSSAAKKGSEHATGQAGKNVERRKDSDHSSEEESATSSAPHGSNDKSVQGKGVTPAMKTQPEEDADRNLSFEAADLMQGVDALVDGEDDADEEQNDEETSPPKGNVSKVSTTQSKPAPTTKAPPPPPPKAPPAKPPTRTRSSFSMQETSSTAPLASESKRGENEDDVDDDTLDDIMPAEKPKASSASSGSQVKALPPSSVSSVEVSRGDARDDKSSETKDIAPSSSDSKADKPKAQVAADADWQTDNWDEEADGTPRREPRASSQPESGTRGSAAAVANPVTADNEFVNDDWDS